MELKGVTAINNILNEFLEQFDCSADIQAIGRQGHGKCRKNGDKEGIHLHFVHDPVDDAAQNSADAGKQHIQKAAAKEHGKSRRPQEIPE